MNRNIPVTTDIVLIGGGHAHVHVLKTFAARPLPGVRVTLVTRDLETPYSGMLPGVIAGIYTPDEAHIDLVRLTALTGTRLIHAEAIGLDRVEKRVLLAGRPAIAYDILAIDVGITPDLAAIAGAAKARHRGEADRWVPGKTRGPAGTMQGRGCAPHRRCRRRRRRGRIAAVAAHAAACRCGP